MRGLRLPPEKGDNVKQKLLDTITSWLMLVILMATLALAFIYVEDGITAKHYTFVQTVMGVVFVACAFWVFRGGNDVK